MTPALAAFALVALAEIGDKSQLVCMTLAARHRPWPVLLGAVLAFALLNLLAVLFGASVAAWIPERVVAFIVAALFFAFGIQTFRTGRNTDSEVEDRPGHSILLTTFLLIFAAEFGDKTQIAVAGLASTASPLAIWFGSTLALGLVSALGVLAGSALLKRIPITILQRVGGGLFLVLAALALVHALTL